MSESRVIITAQAEQAIREFDRLRAQATGSLKQVGELGGKLDGIQSKMADIIQFAAGAIGAHMFVDMVKGSIDTLDSLKDLSVTTKITVEDLSGLKLAAEKSGANLESTADVIAKLSVNIGKNAEKFKRLGITSKEPLEAFKQYADFFVSIKDPQLQAAVSAEALGRSWKGAAPLLAEGSQGIADMVARGKALSHVTTELSAKADEFNDNMAEMKAAVDGAKMELTGQMLPALTEITKAIMTALEESGKLQALWVALGSLGAFAFTDEFSSATVKLKNLNAQLDDLYTSRDIVEGPGGGLLTQVLGTSADFSARIATTRAQIKALQDDMNRPAEQAKTKAEAAEAAKKKAEDDKAAAAAAGKAKDFLQLTQANAKASADAALAMSKASLDSERAIRAESLAQIGELNREGLTSDAQYYAAKRDAALAAGADTVRIKNAEIAALRAYSAKDAAEQIGINSKIAVLSAEKNEALRASLVAADMIRQQYIFDSAAPSRAAQVAADSEIEAINKEIVALEDQYSSYNKMPAAITAATIAKLEAKTVALETNEGSEREIANNNRLIEGLKTRAAWETKVAAQDKGSDLARAQQLLEVMTSVDDLAQSAAANMANTFGKVGAAIGDMTTALTGYGRAQAAIAAQLAGIKSDKSKSPKEIADAEMSASRASAQAQIKSYGDMAGAAKGFFKENTTGYKVMAGAEKAYRAVEMAMAIQTMLAKSGLVAAFTALFTTSKAAEVAADTTATGVSVVNSGVRATADGAAAVAKTAASVPYPYNIAAVASVIALLAGVGVALSGGGAGVDVSKERQAAAGTGSILGDGSAKSESIAKAIELAATNSNIELTHTAGMLRALLSIESNIDNLGNLLVRSGSVTGKIQADTLGAASSFVQGAGAKLTLTSLLDAVTNNFFSKISGKVTNAIFGGNVTALDTGIMTQKGALGSVLANGVQASQYTDTKKDGGWFHSDKYNTQTNSLGAEANDQFTKVLAGMAAGIGAAGKLLGIDGDAFTARLNSFVVDLGKVSTKGMTADEIQKQLEAVFSKAADDMARWSVAGLLEFQKMGEGAFETLTRIAANYANLDSVLESVGMDFGAVGMSSISARERLIDLAGGIDDLASKSNAFAENFLTEAERLAPVTKYVKEQMAALGLASIDTREEFKQQVLGLKLNTAAGQDQYVALMVLADSFAKTHAATEDLTMSEQAIMDQRKDLQTQWDELTMTTAQLQAKARLEVAPANLALFDQIQVQRALKESTLATSDALKSTIDRLTSAKASTIAYRDSLLLGSLSTLTPMQKYLETQRQYTVALSKANATPGDSAAQSGVQSAATAFLTASQVINASSAAFVGDKSKVLADMTTLAAIAGAQMSDAQLQLSRLDAQVSGIATLNQTAVEIVQAIQSQPAAAVPVFDAQRYAAAAGTDALATEVKALREQFAAAQATNAAMLAELKLRRADAERQAAGIEDATGEAGKVIAKGVGAAVEKVTYEIANPTRRSTR